MYIIRRPNRADGSKAVLQSQGLCKVPFTSWPIISFYCTTRYIWRMAQVQPFPFPKVGWQKP